MVVPCLTCKYLDKYEYVFNKETTFYEYHISCEKGVELPCPMVKDGFTCDYYDCRIEKNASVKRSSCVVEVRRD